MSPIQKFYVSSAAPYKTYSQTFNSSSTWTCPVGTTEVDVFAVGGGGGAGGFNWNTTQYYGVTGGGGGGEVIKRTLSVTPGTTYSITVGAGGSGGESSLGGQIGGMSGFNINSYTLINGILQQPMDSNSRARIRYYEGAGSLTSPPSYSSTYSYNSVSEFYSSTTPGVNSAVSNAGMTFAWYLGGSGNSYVGTYFWVPIKSSTSYSASGYFALNTSSSTVNVRIDWYTSLYGSFISASNGSSITANTTWQRSSVTDTSPSNATYALVRYQAVSPGGSVYLSGPQFEEGSSVTAFKSPGFNSPAGSTVIQNLGLISESSSTLIAAGGGGGQTFSPASSANWYGGSYVNRPEYSGVGGGGTYASTGSFPMFGGSGASYNGDPGSPARLHVGNYASTSTTMGSSSTNYVAFDGVGKGNPANWDAASSGSLILDRLAPAYEGMYGAGGNGGRYSTVGNPDVYINGIGMDGRNAMSNTGHGGAGISWESTTSTNWNFQGGSGGSGIVILKWMGQ